MPGRVLVRQAGTHLTNVREPSIGPAYLVQGGEPPALPDAGRRRSTPMAAGGSPAPVVLRCLHAFCGAAPVPARGDAAIFPAGGMSKLSEAKPSKARGRLSERGEAKARRARPRAMAAADTSTPED